MTALILLGIAIFILVVTSAEFKQLIFGRKKYRDNEGDLKDESDHLIIELPKKNDFGSILQKTPAFKKADEPSTIMDELPEGEQIVLKKEILADNSIDMGVNQEEVQESPDEHKPLIQSSSEIDSVSSNIKADQEKYNEPPSLKINHLNDLKSEFCETPELNIPKIESHKLDQNVSVECSSDEETTKDSCQNDVSVVISNVENQDEVRNVSEDDLYEIKEIRSPFGGVYKVKSKIKKVSVSHAEQIKSDNVYPKMDLNKSSVIDVSGESYIIPIADDSSLYKNGAVPDWLGGQIYPNSDIKNENSDRRDFYVIFKQRFLAGSFLNLKGNNNYALILLYDLLKGYEKHKNLLLIENQLDTLQLNYPATEGYCKSAIRKLKTTLNDNHSLKGAHEFSGNNQFIEQEVGLGDRFKEKLQLEEADVRLLNSFSYYENTFTDIEFCYVRLVELFLNLVHLLENYYEEANSTIDREFNYVAHTIARKHYNFREGTDNYKYALNVAWGQFYLYLMKNCENALRELYGVKRKINTHPNYTPKEVSDLYLVKIEVPILKLLPTLVNNVGMPDTASQILLNAHNTTRWKVKFNRIISEFKETEEFVREIDELGDLNRNNPSIENIYYEASKFISRIDQLTGLRYYLTYIFYDLNSVTFNNKELTKTVQKSLFTTEEQFQNFKVILKELIQTKDLKKALKECDDFYTVKRRKIKLDKSIIKDVVKEDSSTTELLNSFLQDDVDDDVTSIKTKEIGNDEIQMKMRFTNATTIESRYRKELNLNSVQIQILNLFKSQNFEVGIDEIEEFTKRYNCFGGHVIESINESCFELLDDNLIEQQNDIYIIDQDYFKEILTC